jgi:hypothetical protein
MDLVTLIVACALSVEPKVMHALIFEQSGGEPWSFSVPSESAPRVLPTIQDAIREARSASSEGGNMRVGLTGLSTDSRSVSAVLFAPCPNITLAARRLTQLIARCKTASKPDPTYCALAAYRGSWDRPDTRFADTVRATVEKGNAPNVEMPKDAYFDGNDSASEPPSSGTHAALTSPEPQRDDRLRGWSSALFPATRPQADGASADGKNDDHSAGKPRTSDPETSGPTTDKASVDRLFVPRSSERRP